MHVLLCISVTESLGNWNRFPRVHQAQVVTTYQAPKYVDPDAIKHLAKSQQSELLDLLDCYSECFAKVPGYSNVISHSITLKEGFKPKRLPAYRVPERLKPIGKFKICWTATLFVLHQAQWLAFWFVS